MEMLTLVVGGMSCGHCKKAVEDSVKKLKGIIDAQVNLEQGVLQLTFNPLQVTLTAIQEAIIDAGYEVRQGGEEGIH
jgi:copper chaperone